MSTYLTEWLIYNPEGGSIPEFSFEGIREEIHLQQRELHQALISLSEMPAVGVVSLESLGLGIERIDVISASKKLITYIKQLFDKLINLLRQVHTKFLAWYKNINIFVVRDVTRYRRYRVKSYNTKKVTLTLDDPWLYNGKGELTTIAGNGFILKNILRDNDGPGAEKGQRAYGVGNIALEIISWIGQIEYLHLNPEAYERVLSDGVLNRNVVDEDSAIFDDIESKVFLEDGSKNPHGWHLTGVSAAVKAMTAKKIVTLQEVLTLLTSINRTIPNVQFIPLEHEFTDRNQVVKELHKLADFLENRASYISLQGTSETSPIKKLDHMVKDIEKRKEDFLKELESPGLSEDRRRLIEIASKDFSMIPQAYTAANKLLIDVNLPLIKAGVSVGKVLEKAILEFDK